MDKRLLKVGLSYLYPSTLELKVWSLRGGSFSISWSAIDWRISSLKCLWQRHKNWNELEMNLPSPPCNYSCGKFSALHRRAIYIQKKSGYEASGDIALTKIQTRISWTSMQYTLWRYMQPLKIAHSSISTSNFLISLRWCEKSESEIMTLLMIPS